MSNLELLAILPQLILSLAIVLQLLLIAIKRSTLMIQAFTAISIVLAASAHYLILPAINTQSTILFYLDGFSIAISVLLLFCAFIVCLVSGRYLKVSQEVHDEYYVLLLLVTLGASLLAISNHFASVFLGLELLSIALIGMVGYLRNRRQTLEASFKYLILSATASSILLFGMAMIYAYSGNLNFHHISDSFLAANNPQMQLLFNAGSVLFIVGLAFKLSLAPFHMWTPDVYQGAPAPVSMLLATVSKTAIFAVLIKFWFFSVQYVTPIGEHQLLNVITFVAIASMLVGNLLALQQTNIKRLLAYSSIAHMGYLLIMLNVMSQQSLQLAWESGLFYLLAYCLATLLLFTFICQTSKANSEQDNDNWQHWNGLFWRAPVQAAAMMCALLSLAGIPLTAGFIGKFYIISTAVDNSAWWLLASLVIGSGIGLYYYLRIIFTLFAKADNQHLIKLNRLSHAVIVGLSITILIFGILPDVISDEVRFFALSKFG
ncbi:NADH-quinone oxidoreductase subunit N [Thalassotalea fonticola]|uniref:NADH-quinone oxidoreductase subunit N n=1 Tax=Thalassotalea fonticola TaxID=3065649 RepID=A0ABZ0GTV7_9GAMM|nr:NADH-quinone oxidoreductase subunit N [Colwelliaceae bacterium S1-1]